MAKVQFKTYTPNEIVLFPSNLGERIPKDHPVRLLSRIVDGLDLTELIRTYKSGGTTPFHPRMLLKVVFYAYMNNIYSCRKIEDAMNWNIQYMWLSGNQHPLLLDNQPLPVRTHEGLREQLVHSGSEDNGGTGPSEPWRTVH